MKLQMVVALCTLVVAEMIIFMSDPSMDMSSYGMANAIFSVLFFFIGLLLVLIKKTRHIGEGILIGTGLILLTGLFLCSS